jgi:hypothetical protein
MIKRIVKDSTLWLPQLVRLASSFHLNNTKGESVGVRIMENFDQTCKNELYQEKSDWFNWFDSFFKVLSTLFYISSVI